MPIVENGCDSDWSGEGAGVAGGVFWGDGIHVDDAEGDAVEGYGCFRVSGKPKGVERDKSWVHR